jgi:hypothetical protein
MKVDMSAEAVTERLKTLDELWLLSVKLMNSKKIKSAKGDENGETIKTKVSDENEEKAELDFNG